MIGHVDDIIKQAQLGSEPCTPEFGRQRSGHNFDE